MYVLYIYTCACADNTHTKANSRRESVSKSDESGIDGGNKREAGELDA